MKGIILAGGSGTRLYPSTMVVCKQLLPVYDKPMIYYPLSTLMLAGIRDVLIISTPEDLPRFEELLGSGDDLGIELSYIVQDAPNGLAEAFILGKEFIGDDSVCLVLGDNIFYGHGLPEMLTEAASLEKGAHVFGYYVSDPERYGVVEFDEDKKVLSLEEKPTRPKSNYAVVGSIFMITVWWKWPKILLPPARGELEITDLNRLYLEKEELTVTPYGAWVRLA